MIRFAIIAVGLVFLLSYFGMGDLVHEGVNFVQTQAKTVNTTGLKGISDKVMCGTNGCAKNKGSKDSQFIGSRG